MSQSNHDNIYGLLYKKERNERLRSGKNKEERGNIYQEKLHRSKALKSLSKWSPIRNKSYEKGDHTILFINTLTAEQYTESFEDIAIEHVDELGMAIADSLAREQEAVIEWYIVGFTEHNKKYSREYKRDEYIYKAICDTETLEGTVRAYNLTEATKLALDVISMEDPYNKNIYHLEVVNPFTTKQVVI